MMRYKIDNKFISIDAPYTAADGTKYPNLQNKEVRDALGVVEVLDSERKDERFYMHVENDDGSLTITPKDMEDGEPYIDLRGVERRPQGLRSFWIAQVKDTAGKLLSRTDWYITRSVERSVAVPPTVVGYRTSVIAESERLESAIKLCTSVEQLIDIVNNQDWPKED